MQNSITIINQKVTKALEHGYHIFVFIRELKKHVDTVRYYYLDLMAYKGETETEYHIGFWPGKTSDVEKLKEEVVKFKNWHANVEVNQIYISNVIGDHACA